MMTMKRYITLYEILNNISILIVNIIVKYKVFFFYSSFLFPLSSNIIEMIKISHYSYPYKKINK